MAKPKAGKKEPDEQISLLISTTEEKILPLIREYIDLAGQPLPRSDSTLKKLNDEHAKCAELLLQQLLKLDSVEVPDGNEGVRMKRRQTVRRMNGQLEQIDQMHKKVESGEAIEPELLVFNAQE